jgi:hypothetical protein
LLKISSIVFHIRKCSSLATRAVVSIIEMRFFSTPRRITEIIAGMPPNATVTDMVFQVDMRLLGRLHCIALLVAERVQTCHSAWSLYGTVALWRAAPGFASFVPQDTHHHKEALKWKKRHYQQQQRPAVVEMMRQRRWQRSRNDASRLGGMSEAPTLQCWAKRVHFLPGKRRDSYGG